MDMTKGFALVVLFAALLIAAAVVQDGGDLDRIAQSGDGGPVASADLRDESAAPRGRVPAVNAAPVSSPVERSSPRPSPWTLPVADEGEIAVGGYSPVEIRRTVPLRTAARPAGSSQDGALSRARLNLEE
jgi:hypothetical protein